MDWSFKLITLFQSLDTINTQCEIIDNLSLIVKIKLKLNLN